MEKPTIRKFESTDSLSSVLDELSQLAQTGEYVFRGYNKQDELLPNIIRGKVNYENVEFDLLKDFERYGSSYFHANNPIDFMSCAQHFGLPTRLLDFTYNPFIALAFSLHGSKSNGKYKEPDNQKYYYIRFASIKENILLHTIPTSDEIYNTAVTRTDSLATKSCHCIDSVTDLFGNNIQQRTAGSFFSAQNGNLDFHAIQRMILRKAILFIDPNQANQRIIMQQGLFMFPYTLDKTKHRDIVKNNSSLIMIHKDLRPMLLKYLDTLGYNPFRLMPDLSNICHTIKQRITDERIAKSDNFKKTN